MRFSFVHAADLHLDSPFRGLPTSDRLRRVFQDATFRAFARVVDLCLQEKVCFLVLAGDLYDAKDRSVRARLFLRDQLLRLDAAGIRTFIVHGNHDPLTRDVAALGLPPSVKVFGDRWEEATVEVDGAVIARVQGISFGQEKVTADLSRHFVRGGAEFSVGLLHCNLGGDAAHDNYAPCTAADLEERGLDYWALGHVHTRAEHPVGGGAVAVYPGNIQGRHANETGERGCVLVSVEGRQTTRRFVPTDVVRWHRLPIDIEGIESVDALVDAAVDGVEAACGQGFDAHGVRLSLVGRGPLHAELSCGAGAEDLARHLGEALSARTPPCLLEGLEVRTLAELDLSAVAESGGLAADVISAVRVLQDSPAQLDALFEDGDLGALQTALRRAGVKVSLRDEAHALLGEATVKAVGLLLEGGT